MKSLFLPEKSTMAALTNMLRTKNCIVITNKAIAQAHQLLLKKNE
jgi:hypothetical protein